MPLRLDLAPAAMASVTTVGIPSVSPQRSTTDGTATARHAPSSATMSEWGRCPRKRTRSIKPRRAASSRSREASGPSPTSSNPSPGCLSRRRGNARRRIFKNDGDRETLLDLAGSVVKKYNWLCHAYCLMDNHYHLLIETPDGNLSRGMRQLNGVYTQTYNRRHRKVGHVFQGRFKAILVEKESYLLELCRYVVLNPVRAKAVERPEDWKWSSYGATVGTSKAPAGLSTDWILGQFDGTRGQARRKYKEFVMAGLGKDNPWRNLKGQILIGREDFVERFRELLTEKESIKEIPRQQRYVNRPELSVIFGEKDGRHRKKLMCEAHVNYGYTLKAIADYLGIHYTTVSKAVRDKNDN